MKSFSKKGFETRGFKNGIYKRGFTKGGFKMGFKKESSKRSYFKKKSFKKEVQKGIIFKRKGFKMEVQKGVILFYRQPDKLTINSKINVFSKKSPPKAAVKGRSKRQEKKNETCRFGDSRDSMEKRMKENINKLNNKFVSNNLSTELSLYLLSLSLRKLYHVIYFDHMSPEMMR